MFDLFSNSPQTVNNLILSLLWMSQEVFVMRIQHLTGTFKSVKTGEKSEFLSVR